MDRRSCRYLTNMAWTLSLLLIYILIVIVGISKTSSVMTAGPLYILTGVAGNVRYPELWADHSLDVSVAPQPETDNYMTLEVSGNTLRLAAFLPDGKQIDSVEIKK